MVARLRHLGSLEHHRDLLEKIALALLERESLDREQVEMLAEGKELPPVRVNPPATTAERPAAANPKSGPATGPGFTDLSPSVARESRVGRSG